MSENEQIRLKKQVFYRVLEALEEKVTTSAYYTVELACQNMGIKPEELTEDQLPRLINEIVEIYKEYYPHRVTDVGNHLTMRLLQKFDIKQKKRRRGFRLFRRR